MKSDSELLRTTQELFYIFDLPGKLDLELVCFVREPKTRFENNPRNIAELESWTYSILVIYINSF